MFLFTMSNAVVVSSQRGVSERNEMIKLRLGKSRFCLVTDVKRRNYWRSMSDRVELTSELWRYNRLKYRIMWLLHYLHCFYCMAKRDTKRMILFISILTLTHVVTLNLNPWKNSNSQ